MYLEAALVELTLNKLWLKTGATVLHWKAI